MALLRHPAPGQIFPPGRRVSISPLRAGLLNPAGFVRLFRSSAPPVFLRGLVWSRSRCLSLFLSSPLPSLACCCCSSRVPADQLSRPLLPRASSPLIESVGGSTIRPSSGRQGRGGKGADDGGLGGAAGVQLLPLPEPRLPPRRHYLQGLSGTEWPCISVFSCHEHSCGA